MLPGNVVDILNFALTLEHLEAEFYTRGMDAAGLIPADVRDVFDQIRKHEVAHVAFLQNALGSAALPRPTFDYTAAGSFADVFSNPQTFMMLAQVFEDTGVRAYKGQAANLMGHNDILLAALKIHSVEARHAAEVRRLRGQKAWIVRNDASGLPAPLAGVYDGEATTFQFVLAQPESDTDAQTAAFDETLTMGQVMNLVKPFIAGGR